MQLFVSLPSGQTRSITVDDSSKSISDLLADMSVHKSSSVVTFAGKQLKLEKSIREYVFHFLEIARFIYSVASFFLFWDIFM